MYYEMKFTNVSTCAKKISYLEWKKVHFSD
jgi:hypothetical protein